eukprot:2492205-Heterocapsa_arctica.AAC.1
MSASGSPAARKMAMKTSTCTGERLPVRRAGSSNGLDRNSARRAEVMRPRKSLLGGQRSFCPNSRTKRVASAWPA